MQNEEKAKLINLKVSKTSYLKDHFENIEISLPSSKDKRKALSTSKLRSKITQHSPLTPTPKEKASNIIQKHIDKLITIQTSQIEKRSLESSLSNKNKTRPLSSGKTKKSTTLRPVPKSTKLDLEIQQNPICLECKNSCQIKSINDPCFYCGKFNKGFSVLTELRILPNTNKVLFVVNDRETFLNKNELCEIVFKIPENNGISKLHRKFSNKVGINTELGWDVKNSHISTPSFKENNDKNLKEKQENMALEVLEREVSFAEGHNFENT
ncbi:hypothetical protein SteCoe_5301 [Stentor coeruleus]|uniref:Uncharacterized protein n=1 Tax=Stentor coeruleus TaxID=5963 RepID=A0A1R2CSJ3_9CILI|nr:hypothetical protein SteCoe_5301 [Stentor coeruleus]